jgi:hypothetical protein
MATRSWWTSTSERGAGPAVAIAVGIAILLALPGPVAGQAAPRTPVASTPHFAFFDDFDTNLNDALVQAGLARKRREPELFHTGEETACFAKLAPAAQAAWDGAVDYYARVISPAEWNARPQFLLRMQLVGFEAEWRGSGNPADLEFVDLARSFRAVAAPAYRACRWSAQEAKNRSWIAEIQPRLASGEAQLAERLEKLYRKPWGKLPILVDVVETVNWSGADTSWSDAGQGDILIANAPGGAAGFEVLFHEASHTLMDRGDPIPRALARAAEAAGVALPRDLWHVVLFYTTGEAVRGLLDTHGEAGYTPMLYEIFARHDWVEYRDALEKNWRPYVEGKRSLDEAAADLIAGLPKPDAE